jgi:hypothetical protein
VHVRISGYKIMSLVYLLIKNTFIQDAWYLSCMGRLLVV